MSEHPICIIVMGVSGSGKTTIGKYIAKKIPAIFQDGDDLHPESNISKMSNGIPLNDTDRLPWLRKIGEVARQYLAEKQTIIIACSALKKKYRDLLREEIKPLRFIFLDGTYEQILQQVNQRKGHFMPEALLRSQFEALEIPGIEEVDVIRVPIGKGETDEVMEVVTGL